MKINKFNCDLPEYVAIGSSVIGLMTSIALVVIFRKTFAAQTTLKKIAITASPIVLGGTISASALCYKSSLKNKTTNADNTERVEAPSVVVSQPELLDAVPQLEEVIEAVPQLEEVIEAVDSQQEVLERARAQLEVDQAQAEIKKITQENLNYFKKVLETKNFTVHGRNFKTVEEPTITLGDFLADTTSPLISVSGGFIKTNVTTYGGWDNKANVTNRSDPCIKLIKENGTEKTFNIFSYENQFFNALNKKTGFFPENP